MKKVLIQNYNDLNLILNNNEFIIGLSNDREVLSGTSTTTTTSAPTTTPAPTTTSTLSYRKIATVDGGTGSRQISDKLTLRDYQTPWWLSE